MSIYKPQNEEEFIAPFGPILGYRKMPPDFVEKMNASLDTNLEDWSDQLVGKVREELKFTETICRSFIEEMGPFLMSYQNQAELFTSMGSTGLATEKIDYSIQIASGWFVRQYENEYNPVHIHPQSMLSCVGYLKLPEGIEKEWAEEYKDHFPSNGHIQFVHGSPASNTGSNFLVKPCVGDFIVFPAHLFHCVYPFKTPGERRSFSVNFSIVGALKKAHASRRTPEVENDAGTRVSRGKKRVPSDEGTPKTSR